MMTNERLHTCTTKRQRLPIQSTASTARQQTQTQPRQPAITHRNHPRHHHTGTVIIHSRIPARVELAAKHHILWVAWLHVTTSSCMERQQSNQSTQDNPGTAPITLCGMRQTSHARRHIRHRTHRSTQPGWKPQRLWCKPSKLQ